MISSLPPPGLRVERHATDAGRIEFDAGADHCIRMQVNGPVRGACSGHRFVYTQGDMDVWPAGLADTWYENDAGESIVLRLPQSLLAYVAEESGRDPARIAIAPRHQFRDPRIEHIVWAADVECRTGQASGRLYLDSLGLALAAHLLGEAIVEPRRPRGLTRTQRERVLSYIEAHLASPLSLVELARVAGVSASHLKVLFKRSMGMPVHAYVTQRRVARARELLVKGGMPAAHVALEAGFAHQSHMARWMRRLLGVTPRELVRGSGSR